MTPASRSRIWRELKPFVGPAVIVVLYAIVRVVHRVVSSSDGLLSPSGAVDNKLAALTLLTLTMRTFVLVIIPGVVVFRLVMRLLRGWYQPDAP